MAKYTDEQIKKALMQCKAEYSCKGCPYEAVEDCFVIRNADCLDLINRQEAEIERLNDVVERIQHHSRTLCILEEKQINRIKSEAIKEFAERLKTEMLKSKYNVIESQYARACNAVLDFWVEEIDNLVKEMVGEGE